MEEYLIIAHNFKIPVDVILAGRHVTGIVEEIDEDGRVKIKGRWYPMVRLEWYSGDEHEKDGTYH